MDLATYELLKWELADLVRAVPWRAEQAARNRSLFASLADDRFNLAVIGRYSRGKSTLMNAMLATDRLPMGSEPLTSVITSVTYGSTERVILHYENTTLFLEIGLGELEDHITERGNPGNYRRIREAEIQIPAELLRRGFRFIDTPGLDSGIAGNTATTERFLPEADAFILVAGFDGPLTSAEHAILRMARATGRRVFVVMNKADLASDHDRPRMLDALHAVCGTDMLVAGDVYPISARLGLAARLQHDPDQLARSGLPDLEAAVISFLIREKHRDFLRSMCGRVAGILAGEAGAADALSRLATLRARIEADAGAFEPASSDILPTRIPACPVCVQAERAAIDLVAILQARLRTDAAARADFLAGGGLCGPHTRLFSSLSAPREVCTALAPLLVERARRLRDVASGADIGASLGDAMPAAGGCSVCSTEADASRARITELAARVRAGSDLDVAAICLPHLAGIAETLGDDPARRARFIERQAAVLERFADSMRRFAIRLDASDRSGLGREDHEAARHGQDALVGRPAADAPAAWFRTR